MTYLNEFVSMMRQHVWTYWKGSPYPWFLAAALGICIFLAVKKKDRTAAALAAYTVIISALLFFPVSALMIAKLIGEDIYWRLFWALPMLPAVGYAACALIRMLPEKGIPGRLLRTGATLGVCLLIAGAGSLQYTSGDFLKTVNDLQIPDDVYEIGELITADWLADGRQDEKLRVAADDYVASYLRLYDPTIRMPYGRRRQGARGKNARRLYLRIQKRTYPEKLAWRGHKAKCKYIVLMDNLSDPEFMTAVLSNGYDYFAKVGEYFILKENVEYAKEFAAKRAAKKAEKAAAAAETETNSQ